MTQGGQDIFFGPAMSMTFIIATHSKGKINNEEEICVNSKCYIVSFITRTQKWQEST